MHNKRIIIIWEWWIGDYTISIYVEGMTCWDIRSLFVFFLLNVKLTRKSLFLVIGFRLFRTFMYFSWLFMCFMCFFNIVFFLLFVVLLAMLWREAQLMQDVEKRHHNDAKHSCRIFIIIILITFLFKKANKRFMHKLHTVLAIFN